MKNVFVNAIKLHKRLLNEFERENLAKIENIASVIKESLNKGGIIYLFGNGGSAADAQHVAGEFIGRFKKERKALPAIALTTDSSILTCVGNDFGFDSIFSRQVEALVTEKDITWVFSTSGKSKNIVNAVELAKKKGAKVIAFVGGSTSILEEMSDVCLNVRSTATSAIQEIHQLAYHIVCALVDE